MKLIIAPPNLTLQSRPHHSLRSMFFLKKYWKGLLLLGLMVCGASAQAQVVAQSVVSAQDLGRGQDVNVTVNWIRDATAAGDKITVVIPTQLTVDPPAPPAGCVYTAPNMVCDVPDGSIGASGSIVFLVRGAVLGGFNITASGTSPGLASFSGTVRSTGDLIVGKVKTSPAGNAVAGGAVVFELTPQITGGDDVPVGASIVVTDNLPGTLADFTLTNVAFAGLPRSCNTTANANATRKLICTYSGAFTRAQLNLSKITVTGTAGNNGTFSNVASIASGNTEYFDADLDNNTGTVNYTVDPGTDIQALGNFPVAGQLVNAAQNLVLTHKNNGPLASPIGGVVQTIVPAGFIIGTLPAACTSTAAQSITVGGTQYNGTLVSCSVGALAVGAQQNFTLPLTMPATPGASSFPVEVLTPPGRGDANLGNNTLLLPYQIVNPYADLRASKSKSKTGPQAPGTTVDTTLTIRNDAASPSAAAYDNAHPLRIVDYARPEEVDGGSVTNVSAGWTCTVNTGVVPPLFVGDPAKTTRIACENLGPGSLAPNASVSVTFRSTIAAVLSPVTLTDRACTGSQALTALGIADVDGPQPPDGGRIGNDCADAGTGLVATPIVSGSAQISIKKESSVDNVNFFDDVVNAPNLVADGNNLFWRMIITTPVKGGGAGENPNQEVIPTLYLTDNLPGIMNQTSSGPPAPNFKTPAITVITTPNTYGSCPNVASGLAALSCTFTNVPAGTTITVDVPVTRPMAAGLQTNTGILTSPNAILTAPVGGQLSDNAAVNILPRTDIALTTKAVTPATPSVGEIVSFAITAQNLGEDAVAIGNFTITDNLNTGAPTLAVPSYEIIDATPSNPAQMSCAASNYATGAISCTNLVTVNRYNTQTITIKARIKKPSGIGGAANSILYTGVTNTASVVLGGGMCEYRTETTTMPVSASATCNDAAAKSNNSKTVTFDIKVPAIDLQQSKKSVYPGAATQFLIGDQLRYRFSVRNAGPSRAEDIVMTDILTVPAGFSISVAAAMPDNINSAPASAGYTLKAKTVSCTQSGANANVVCGLNVDPLLSFLDAGEEVNFEIAMDMTGVATGPVVFGNTVYVCADETNTYESSGKCSPNSALAGNNLAAVNDVVFPKADLEVVSKTAVTPSPVDVAQPIEYDIVLRNNGTSETPKMRLVDTLPTGFEWINTGVQAPKVAVNGGSAATLTAVGGNLTVSAGVPANGTENVCFISNGITNVTTLVQRQAITCDISGSFPPGAANTITLKLFARAKSGLYDGTAGAPYLTNRTNSAQIYPGKDAANENISVDSNPPNDAKTTDIQVQTAQIGGRVFLDLNNNGDQNDATLTTDQGIGNVTLTLTGTDKYGNPVSRTLTTNNSAAGVGSLRGDYLFANLPPSDAAGYTITQTQPVAYGNGIPQPNTPRTVRNGLSTGVSSSGGAYTVNNTVNESVIGGVVLAGGAVGVQFDFPETQKPYLSGFVYLDLNNDGNKNVGEDGINAVTMTLIGCRAGPNGTLDSPGPIGAGPAVCGGDDVAVNRTVATDVNGKYLFALDEPGRYSVIQQAVQPVVAGLATLRGKTTAGSVDLITSPEGTNNGGTRGTVNATNTNAGGNPGVLEEINVAVAASQLRDIVINNSAAISVNNNFGEITPASIAGVVYTEKGGLNSNFQAGVDWPLPGAKIVLTGTDDLGQAVTETITTLADGRYSFKQLRPGTYKIVKTNPASITNEVGGAFPGKDDANTVLGTRVDDDTINTITLVSGTKVTQTNFAVTNGPPPYVPPDPALLKIVKSHTGDISADAPASYVLKISNIGGSPTAGLIQVSDLLPVGMKLIAIKPITSGFGSITNVVVVDQVVTFELTPNAPFNVGDTLTILVNVDVSPTATGTLINYAAVSGGGDPFVKTPPGPACNDANHCTQDPATIVKPKPKLKPKLTLVKSHSGSMTIGKVGTYNLNVTNNGELATSGSLQLSDLLPNGMSLIASNPVTSSFGSITKVITNGQLVKFDFTPAAPIAVGQSVNLTVSVNIGVAAVGNVINYASVSGGDDPFKDTPPGSSCADADHCSKDATVVKGSPVLTLAKTGPANLNVGGNGEYALTVKNTGESPTTGVLHLIEKLPPGLSLNGQISSIDGVISNVVSSGNINEGLMIKFDLMPNQPLVEVTGKATITVPVTVGGTTLIGVITNYASVGGGGDTRDDGNPPIPSSNCNDTRCANAPSIVAGIGKLSITKTVNKTEAQLGDLVSYTVTIANIGTSPVPQPDIVDRLPAGFRLVENTSRVTGAKLLKLSGAPGAVLTYSLDTIQPSKSVTITYRVRLGVGAMQGDGVNRVTAQCRFNSDPKCSNEAQAKVRITGGVFSSEACVTGMVYVDCNGNQVKDREELGIPGVRMYVEDGTFLISDSEGKYGYCGLSPKTHVLKVDQVTLPRGSRLISSSNRNAGDANSLFLDLKNGEMQRADFIEASCSNTVLEQVKARRTLGEVTGPQSEKKGGAGLTFEGRAPNYPRQGTDSANQIIVKPRTDSSKDINKKPVLKTESERDTPLQQLEINQGGRRE